MLRAQRVKEALQLMDYPSNIKDQVIAATFLQDIGYLVDQETQNNGEVGAPYLEGMNAPQLVCDLVKGSSVDLKDSAYLVKLNDGKGQMALDTYRDVDKNPPLDIGELLLSIFL
jgi:hypothetical protein